MLARALEFSAPKKISLVDVEVRPPGEGEVLVRTLFSGISSGTEMLAYRGEIDPAVPLDEAIGALGGTFSFPFRYGNSCAGVVESSRGDPVEGTAVFCLHPHQSRFVCPASDVVVVDGADLRIATMFPLVETALQITLDAGSRHEEDVLVAGLGPVGLLTSILFTRAGARVLGSDPRVDRRRAAEELGVPAVAPEEVAGAIGEATQGRGADLVVEASGEPAALVDALRVLAHEGTALVASWYGAKAVPLPLGADFHRRRLTIRSTQVSTIPSRLRARWSIERRRRTARALLDELPLKTLASHEFAFEDAPRAYAAVDAGERGLLHAALRYETPA